MEDVPQGLHTSRGSVNNISGRKLSPTQFPLNLQLKRRRTDRRFDVSEYGNIGIHSCSPVTDGS